MQWSNGKKEHSGEYIFLLNRYEFSIARVVYYYYSIINLSGWLCKSTGIGILVS